ncbi:MAG: GGDEF domain-containing protein [Nitrospiria bacterium]
MQSGDEKQPIKISPNCLAKKKSHQTLQTIAEENKRLKQELRQKNRELSYFVNIGKELAGILEFNKVIRVILSAARRLIRCEDWSLLLRDETSNLFYYKLGKRASMKVLKTIRYKLGEGPVGWVAKKGLPLLISDFSKQRRFQDKNFYSHIEIRSLLCLPIKANDQVIGVVQMINRLGPASFTESDLHILANLIEQASLTIERSDLYKKMSELVTTDDLTHLYNLRYLDRVLESEIMRCQRYGTSLSFIFIDLDHFKQVNDHHGHLLGSQVLVEVAEILTKNLRDVDIIARYGGDEFVAVLPETAVDQAGRVSERICSAIRRYQFLKRQGLSLKITASLGVSGVPDHADNKKDLIYFADKAMYQAKNTGRDRVCLTGFTDT